MIPDATPDPYWTVCKPRNGSERAIEEMNAKLMSFHPALREHNHFGDPDSRRHTRAIVDGDFSVAELFRSILSRPQD